MRSDDTDDSAFGQEDFPVKDKKRALRRHLARKTKNKAEQLVHFANWTKESAVKLAEHLAFCDKECCHNPRHGNGHADKTIQELKAELKEKDEQEI